ncbi:MAG: histidine phosphatase family protein, partial [Nanoarchaeota archaeon]|nr:histidine phosphatase family protein [Nanoarchaeota archaeon]
NLYFIRHAESEMNLRGDLIGGRCADAQLTEKGKLQAQVLGQYLKDNNIFFSEVHSSPILRALDTAKYVCTAQNFPLENIIQWDALQELSHGNWEMQSRAEKFTSEVYARMNLEHWDYRSPHGESQREVAERMYGFVKDRFLWRYERAVVGDIAAGIFTHGMAIKCLLREVLDHDPRMIWKTATDNTSITRFKYDQHGWHVLGVNMTPHLGKELR